MLCKILKDPANRQGLLAASSAGEFIGLVKAIESNLPSIAVAQQGARRENKISDAELAGELREGGEVCHSPPTTSVFRILARAKAWIRLSR